MHDFKKLTIQELMNLLQSFTKKNIERIHENSQTISKIGRSNKTPKEIRNLQKILYDNNSNLIKENKKFIKLFNGLIDINQLFNKQFELDQDISQNELNSNKEQVEELGISNLNELKQLLDQYILEEKYEECEVLKKQIKKLELKKSNQKKEN